MKDTNRALPCAVAAFAGLAFSLSVSATETQHALDAAAYHEDYLAKAAACNAKSAEFRTKQREWNKRRAAAEKAGQRFDEPEPQRDFEEVFDGSIYPQAEKRADAAIAGELATLAARQEAWDKADPKTREKRRPGKPARKVVPEPGDEVGLRSTCAYRAWTGRVVHDPVSVTADFDEVGPHTVWIRHWCDEKATAQLSLRVVAPNGETCRWQILNRIPGLQESLSREGRSYGTDAKEGWMWTSAELNVEMPGAYKIIVDSFSRNVPKPELVKASTFAVRDIWVTNDKAFDSAKPVAKKSSSAGPRAPKGFVAARRHPIHASLNTAVMDSQKRLLTNFMESYGWYGDIPGLVSLGGVDLYSSGDREVAKKFGMTFQQNVASNLPRPKKLKKGETPPPEEPVKLVEGAGWWSEQFRREYSKMYAVAEKSVKDTLAQDYDEGLACWWTAWEQCGSYDYSTNSVLDYRVFLKWKHGSLDALNAAWHTEYKSFDEIEPAKWDDFYGEGWKTNANSLARHQAMANFVDFRDFRSKHYATVIGVKTDAVVKNDTRGPNGGPRHVSSNLSANNVASVMWMRWRPLDFEDTAQITMKGSDMIGYDNYGTDDVMGAFYETFDAFGDGKLRPMVREGSTHAPEPEVYARTVWGNVAKGMRGMDTFVWQESGNGPRQGELQKFGLSNMYDDGAPRPKLAAASDCYRAMHQLDHLLTETKRVRAVKPVAIYYTSACNVLQERPYASIFDPGPDNVFRVYELIHANGYDCTFVTPRQIRENGDWMKSLQAIVFVDATYIPKDVQQKVREWVEQGGHVFADAQSGSCDGYTYPTPEFTEWLGVRPVAQKKVAKDAAANLSFGYSSYAFDVIQRDELYKTSCEVKDTPGGEHPISKLLGKAMISAMGFNEIQCVEGSVVLQENNSRPYMTIRDHGKGTSTYFAGYVGTMYGAGCTQYEWRDNHADNSPYRVIDAWLTHIGAKKIEVNDLPRNLAYSMRFESPSLDARGNAFIAFVSQLPGDAPGFRAKYVMPEGFKAPKMCLTTANGSRRIEQVPFAYDEKTRELTVRVPGFSAWRNVIALNDLQPLVSVEFAEGTKRDAYRLADVRPGEELVAKVRVFNPSAAKLAGGKVELRLPDGWFYDRETAEVDEVAAYGVSQELTFRIRTPDVNCARRLRPVNFVYRDAKLPNGSGPAVEMVWFQKEPQNAPSADWAL